MCTNDLFNKFKQLQTSSVLTDDIQIYLYSTISCNYMTLLKMQFENYLFFQNTLADFDQKEESQQIFIMQKIVSMLFLLGKMYKEVDISLQKFPNHKLIGTLVKLLLNDISTYYPQIVNFLKPRVDCMIQKDEKVASKLYQLYSDSLRLSRVIKQMLSLQSLLQEKVNPCEIEIFSVDIIKNKEIEKYFCKKNIIPNSAEEKKDVVEKKQQFVKRQSQTQHEPSPFISLNSVENTPLQEKIPNIPEIQKSHSQILPKNKEMQSAESPVRSHKKKTESITQFTTQQSLLSSSDGGETRVFGMSRQGSQIISSDSKIKVGFFQVQNGPLGFLSSEK